MIRNTNPPFRHSAIPHWRPVTDALGENLARQDSIRYQSIPRDTTACLSTAAVRAAHFVSARAPAVYVSITHAVEWLLLHDRDAGLAAASVGGSRALRRLATLRGDVQ